MAIRAFLFTILFAAAMNVCAQPPACVFKDAQIKIDFGAGSNHTFNNESQYYGRVNGSCPIDGYYSYSSFTSDCFGGDWQTITEDHTPGDVEGNMMLVNAAPGPGTFLKTTINGFKGNTTYELGVWLMNVCRISDKCGIVLLPNLTFHVQTPDGAVLAKFRTGDVPRLPDVRWMQHKGVFTTPPSVTSIVLILVDDSPGGCGNDFAVDDITFRECIIPPPVVTTPKPKPVATKKSPVAKPVAEPEKKEPQPSRTATAKIDSSPAITPKNVRTLFPPPPAVLTNRSNPLVKTIQTDPAEIKIELYDNGQIDGDTVSIYHNNVLIKSNARLSDKPISFTITVNASEPYHELIMVAENLGEIPPNTSVMIITAGSSRYEVFISSTEQKNAKVVIELKK